MGDTPLPLQSSNPTECLAKARDLPLHVGKQSSAFQAVAKQVFPLQRTLSTRLVLALLRSPKSHLLIEHILLQMSPALLPLFGVFLGCPCCLWVLGGTPEGWGLQGCDTRGWKCS